MGGVSAENSSATGSRVDQWIKQQEEDPVRMFAYGKLFCVRTVKQSPYTNSEYKPTVAEIYGVL